MCYIEVKRATAFPGVRRWRDRERRCRLDNATASLVTAGSGGAPLPVGWPQIFRAQGRHEAKSGWA